MSRNIVVCSDGTGNTLENTREKQATNVVRLVQSLVLDDPDRQIVFYDQGVGTVGPSDPTADVPAGEGLVVLAESGALSLAPTFAHRLGDQIPQLLLSLVKDLEVQREDRCQWTCPAADPLPATRSRCAACRLRRAIRLLREHKPL